MGLNPHAHSQDPTMLLDTPIFDGDEGVALDIERPT